MRTLLQKMGYSDADIRQMSVYDKAVMKDIYLLSFKAIGLPELKCVGCDRPTGTMSSAICPLCCSNLQAHGRMAKR